MLRDRMAEGGPEAGLRLAPRERAAYDRVIDGLNRLPRPVMAVGTLALIGAALVAPDWFAGRMEALAAMPEALWWIMGGSSRCISGRGSRRMTRSFSARFWRLSWPCRRPRCLARDAAGSGDGHRCGARAPRAAAGREPGALITRCLPGFFLPRDRMPRLPRLAGRGDYPRLARMIIELGHFALILAACIAVLQMVVPLVGAHKGWRGWMAFGEPAATSQLILVGFSFAALDLGLCRLGLFGPTGLSEFEQRQAPDLQDQRSLGEP